MGIGVFQRLELRRIGLYSAALALLSVTLTGCTQNSSTAGLPRPTFNGPQIVAPVAPPKAAPPALAAGGIPRDWVPYAKSRAWKWVIIHHSATPTGGARKFNQDHRERGFDDLGYDFVIGNGTDTRDGQIEVGPRWGPQRVGAHTQDTQTKYNRYNEHGIGICLVGNFDKGRPTPAQLQSLAKLVAYLQKTYRIRPADVVGHRDCKATDCPGQNLSIAVVRRMAAQTLASAGEQIPGSTTEVRMAGELLVPSGQ